MGGCTEPGAESGTCDEGGILLWDFNRGATRATALGGFGDLVTSMAITSDGKRLGAGSQDGSVRVWDMGELALPRVTALSLRFPVASVSFGADGQFLTAGHWSETVSVWDLDYPAPSAFFTGHRGYVYSVAFGPGDRTLASAGADGTIRLWASIPAVADLLCERMGRNVTVDECNLLASTRIRYQATCLSANALATPATTRS